MLLCIYVYLTACLHLRRAVSVYSPHWLFILQDDDAFAQTNSLLFVLLSSCDVHGLPGACGVALAVMAAPLVEAFVVVCCSCANGIGVYNSRVTL